MICCKRILSLCAVLGASLLFTGCGYRSAPFPDATRMSNPSPCGSEKRYTGDAAASVMRQQLCERIQFDGGLTLKNLGSSDCVLYGKIVKVSNMTIREGQHGQRHHLSTAEFMLSVTLEFTVLIPGRGEPLIPPAVSWARRAIRFWPIRRSVGQTRSNRPVTTPQDWRWSTQRKHGKQLRGFL